MAEMMARRTTGGIPSPQIIFLLFLSTILYTQTLNQIHTFQKRVTRATYSHRTKVFVEKYGAEDFCPVTVCSRKCMRLPTGSWLRVIMSGRL